MKEIIKALGFDPLPTAIIILQLGVISFLFKKFYNNVSDNFKEVIETRKEEIEIVKKSIENLSTDIEIIKNKISINNETTTSLVYHQCFNEAKKWQDKGYIDLGSKKYFDKMWDNYIKLGDGLGREPKDIIDSLTIKN